MSTAPLFSTCLAGVLGLCLGSFLNVVIVRLPLGESVVWPRSRCMTCGNEISWYHNIPLVSWLMLRGRCAECDAGISWQYPVVELATAAIWAGNVYAYGLTPRAVQGIVLMTILLAIAFTDGRHYLIPDPLSLGGAAAGLALSFLPGPLSPLESITGLLVGGGVLWLIAIAGTRVFGEDAMGGGDIKLMAMVGAFLGWAGAILTIFIGALLGALIFGPISLRSKRLVPFGIFLAIGAVVTFIVGDRFIGWYLGRFV